MKSMATQLVLAAVLLPALSIGQTFSNMSNLLPQSFNSGGCVGVCDMNQDGYDDIIVLHEATDIHVLYQQADGSFTHTEFGSVSGSNQWGMAIADVDNDGHNDVYSGGAYDGTHMFMLHEDGSSDLLSLDEGSLFMQGANLADMNGDGWLDAFGCHDDAESRIWTNDGMGALLPNNGLIDMVTTPASDNSGNYGSVWTDFDRDGDTDLYIAKCRQGVSDPYDMRRVNALFENDGSGNYSNNTESRGMVVNEQSWTSDFADIDNDGDFDLFLTNHSNTLMILENDGAGNFTDITAGSGLEIGGFFLQAKMVDFDNDGFVDLLYSGGLHACFHGNGDGTFTEMPGMFPADDTMHSFSIGDLNKDGYLDVYASYGGGYVSPDYDNDDMLWISEGGDNHWIGFDLEGSASGNNAVGALVQIQGDFGVQIREIRSGESYGITNSFQMHFGLGDNTDVDVVTVFWPSGETTVIEDPTVDSYTVIEETDCDLTGIEITTDGGLQMCPGESIDLMAPMGYSYVWTNGASSQVLTVTEGGNYTVVAYDESGCSAASTTVTVVMVTPTPPTISIVGDTEFCEGSNAVLTSSEAAEYDWSDGSDTQSIVVTASGDYSVAVTDICDNPNSSDVISITVLESAATPVIDDIILDFPGEGVIIGSSENLTWYDTETSDTPLYQGAEYTANYTVTSSVWVEDVMYHGGGEGQGGLQDMTENGQYHFNSNFHLQFDAYDDIVINSVVVFAEGAGDREIGVLDGFGNIIASGSFACEAGENTLMLGFEVPMGEGYGLVSMDDEPYLWRDQSDDNLDFPMALGALGAITGTSVTSDNWDNYFYFFYDWNVSGQQVACASERIEVLVTVVGLDELQGQASLEVYPNPTHGQLNLAIDAVNGGTVNVQLTDATGRTVVAEQWTVATGSQVRTLDVSQLATGVYALEVVLNGARATRQIVVE